MTLSPVLLMSSLVTECLQHRGSAVGGREGMEGKE